MMQFPVSEMPQIPERIIRLQGHIWTHVVREAPVMVRVHMLCCSVMGFLVLEGNSGGFSVLLCAGEERSVGEVLVSNWDMASVHPLLRVISISSLRAYLPWFGTECSLIFIV